MKKIILGELTTSDLVARFAQIGVAQDEALLGGQITKFNRLFRLMTEVADELKRREGDQRCALVALYDYPNMQVRLNAAKDTLAVAPIAARQQLEAIADSKWFPQAGDAGMSLSNLDRGIFRPK